MFTTGRDVPRAIVLHNPRLTGTGRGAGGVSATASTIVFDDCAELMLHFARENFILCMYRVFH